MLSFTDDQKNIDLMRRQTKKCRYLLDSHKNHLLPKQTSNKTKRSTPTTLATNRPHHKNMGRYTPLYGSLSSIIFRGRHQDGTDVRKNYHHQEKNLLVLGETNDLLLGSYSSIVHHDSDSGRGSSSVDFSSCSICLKEFDSDDDVVQSRNCHHVHHRECLEKWVHKRNCCPYCRQEMLEPGLYTKWNQDDDDDDDFIDG
jgi:hypothetical protein